MPTLNQYASKIANMVGQPSNHEMKERIKDAFKATFANRIRQSSERNGIDSILTLTYIAEVIEVDSNDSIPKPTNYKTTKKEFTTLNKVPVPIRIKSDAPFISVTDDTEHFNFIACSKAELRLRNSSLPTGFLCSYTLINNKLLLNIATDVEGLTFNNWWGYTAVGDSSMPKYIKITGIFESPEEVLGMYAKEDGQDIELPLPNDMLEDIMYQILKVEFGVIPREMEVKINTPIPTTR